MKFRLLQKNNRKQVFPILFHHKCFFGKEPKLSKYLVTTVPQPNIKNIITFFVYLELKVTDIVPFPPSNDGLGIDGFSIETLNGMENTKTWCGKSQARCYVVQVVYLETMETTMERMEIGEEKSMIDFPMHIGTE
jgi:hypothetical protein